MKRDSILVVDDMEINRSILCEMFKDKYRVLEAENGKKALEIIEKEKNYLAIVLLDIIMPKLDGFDVLEEMTNKGYMHYIPVILITGDASDSSVSKGYDYGVADIITKPFNIYIVRKRVENIIGLYLHKNDLEYLVTKQTEKLERQAKKLQENNNQIIETLSTVVEFRNLESGEHIKRIKSFTKILIDYVARDYLEYNLTPEQTDMIVTASSMHDIGKIAIPDNILLKPGRLTQEEFEIMKTHTIKGCEILDMFSFIEDKQFFKYCYEICRYHHERYDGRGYPDKLKRDEIPISAQVVSVADVFDALVSKRVYKTAYSKEKAYSMIFNGECGIFSPKILECLKKAKNEFFNLVED